jgi:hypothetical protein
MEGDRKLGVTALEKENQIIGFTYNFLRSVMR